MNFKKDVLNKIFWVTIFAITMAYLETAIVVYLRELYYPNGFSFPLMPIENNIAIVEIGREFATILMLISISVLVAKKFTERFAYFLLSFAVWDIFYYVFLKLLLNWPESFLTWDILFLIPIPWVGPVIAPVLLSLTMIFFAVLILFFNIEFERVKIKALDWMLLTLGSLVVILSFVRDYASFVLSKYNLSEIFQPDSKDALMTMSLKYFPNEFIWWIFWLGEIIILLGIFTFYNRTKGLLRKDKIEV
ncbi:MAG: hypothetical protein U9R42_00155 [Bacteroidota bacterium]|nr:hypothetical protein [Bacteroidota bacterium]